MDVFLFGSTPESIWLEGSAAEEGVESADFFVTAMENNFLVGKIIINAFYRCSGLTNMPIFMAK